MFILAKILKALHSDSGPWSLAFGVVLGMLIGLTPIDRLHNLILLFVVLFFRVNLSTFLLSLGLFSALAFALDPVMSHLGEIILTSESLQTTWTALYSTGLGRLSQFSHTLTMGSLVVGLVFSPILLFVSKFLIVEYRERFLERVEKMKLVQFVKGTQAFQLYQRMES